MDEFVLIIDDDQKLQELLREYLGEAGFRTRSHYEGKGARELVLDLNPSLILLDIMLPGMDGLDVLREIRRDSNTPVIMLTARGEDTDRIVGLELGADDYLPKPFNPRELLARIRAILRRARLDESAGDGRDSSRNNSGLKADGSIKELKGLIEVDGLGLDCINQTLQGANDTVELGAAEARLLEVLMEHANQTLSRDELMNLTRGRDFMAFERSIDVHISKLRANLARVETKKTRIKTIRGIGYMFLAEIQEK